jgi:hypothetical protein
MVSVAALLESAAFMAWWTWIVLGQKHVADATAARRSVDYRATEAALVANASVCHRASVPAPRDLGNYTPSVGVQGSTQGKLEIGNLISLVSAVAIGQQATFEIYVQPFGKSSTSATVGEVVAPALLGGGSETFQARRRTACIEPTRDQPKTSVADYRKSVFSLIQGY